MSVLDLPFRVRLLTVCWQHQVLLALFGFFVSHQPVAFVSAPDHFQLRVLPGPFDGRPDDLDSWLRMD